MALHDWSFLLLFRYAVWLLLMAAATTELIQEPVCSKFSFEEKVLEKLVRLEHKMQLQQENMAAWEKVLEAKLVAQKEAEGRIDAAFKDITAKENVILEKMERMVEETHSSITVFTSNVTEDVRVKIQTFMEDHRLVTIAFKAREVTSKSTIAGGRLVFATEVLNVGDAYNKSTGFFTSPVDGLYLFTVQICTTPKSYLNVYIVAKGTTVGTATHKADYSDTCTSGDGLAVLNKGDTVWIRTDDTGTDVIFEDYDDWNSFSGILIR